MRWLFSGKESGCRMMPVRKRCCSEQTLGPIPEPRASNFSVLRQQLAPWAPQRFLNSECGRHQHIDVTSLDFLNRTDVKVNQFGQPLLSRAILGSLTADVRADLFELALNCRIVLHALLGRIFQLTRTAQWGVI